MQFSTANDFLAFIGKNRPSLLIIRGQDDFAIDEAVARIWQYYPGFVIEKQEDLSQLAVSLNSFSLFSEKRLIFVPLVEALKEKEESLLAGYLKRPNPDIVVLIVTESAKGNPELENDACVLLLPKAAPWEKEAKIASWITLYLKERGYAIQSGVAARLAKGSHDNHALLVQELAKLMTYVGDKKEIGDVDVDTISTLDQEKTLWQLSDALLQTNASLALSTFSSLENQEIHSFVIVRHIRNTLHQAFVIASLAESGEPSGKIAERFAQLKGKLFEKAYATATRLGSSRLQRALLLIDKTQNALKDSVADEKTLLQTTLLKIKHALSTS
jgi:DNA polymerase-3 subunit delta